MNLRVKFTETDLEFTPEMGKTTVLSNGENGATFIPSVSEDGVLSWTNDRELENPAPVNIKGADGKDGKDGLDGADGKDGQDGYTPIKGIDYFDGSDGIDGKDGLDGKDGKDGAEGKPGANGKDGENGKDGISPTVTVSKRGTSTIIEITDATGVHTATISDGTPGKNGENGADGADGADGINGKDGNTPYIQDGYWYINGVNTNVKAQGVDGKNGENGIDGEDGADGVGISKIEKTDTNGKIDTYTITLTNGNKFTFTVTNGNDGTNGKDGADGKTPVKGTDYYTPEEEAEWEDFITSELAKKGQLKPEFAQSEAWLIENGDTSKQYVIPPSRDIYEYGTSVEGTANAVETAEAWNSTTPYNGVGYRDGAYLSISTTTAAENVSGDANYTTVGYIPYNDINGTFPEIYIKGESWVAESHSRLYFFKEDKGMEWGANSSLNIIGSNASLSTYFDLTVLDASAEYWKLTPKTAFNECIGNNGVAVINTIAYFRICLKGKGANLNISVGTPISEGGTGWSKTGEQYLSVDSTINDTLWGKKVVFAGDSICHASTDETQKNGWAGRIGANHSMEWRNAGISGGTLTRGVAGSAGCISDIDFGDAPDYIILEGGTNDADLIGGKDGSGNMPAKYGSYDLYYYEHDFDETTFCGAVESLFLRLTTDYAGAKIGFIIAHKMGGLSTNDGYYYNAENNKRRYYFETIIALCKKWGIPYIDLWEGCYLNPMNTKHNGGSDPFYSNGDYQHLTAKGYDYITPMIEKWMETL